MTKPGRVALAMIAALAIQGMANAQMAVPSAPPVPEPGAIALPAGQGASKGSEVWNLFGPGNPVVRNVTQATLTPVLPAPGKANGAAVTVAPGGGFMMLSMQTEGFGVARLLADQGITAFVLKYRLEPTPVPSSEFLPAMMKRFQQAGANPGGMRTIPDHPASDADALAALRLIRNHAAQWHVDPRRVGIIGYSAGAMTALSLAQKAPADEKPAFLGYIYGPQAIDAAPDNAPPLFDAIAIDDPLFGTTNFPIVGAWKAAKRPVELHVYGSGGHGFGTGKPGQTHSLLINEFVAWLNMQGFLAPSTDH